MKIGVVCEGPSDFPAIAHFVGESLRSRNITPEFGVLFPEKDKTRQTGGWASIFSWMQKYPPEARVQQFFSSGIFGGSLTTKPYDLIIFQMDTDVLDSSSFADYVKKTYGHKVKKDQDPAARAHQVAGVIDQALALDQLTNRDASRHIPFPAVESTESWCIGIFHNQSIAAEALKGEDLTESFMKVLERSESKEPKDMYNNIDKSQKRRYRFCEKHRNNINRLERNCPVYMSYIQNVLNAIQE